MSIVQEKMYMDSLLRRWFQAAVLPLDAALYAERYPQDAAGCGRGDRRQGGRGDRPQQYRRASRLEIAVGCQCHRDHGAQPYA